MIKVNFLFEKNNALQLDPTQHHLENVTSMVLFICFHATFSYLNKLKKKKVAKMY